MYQAELEYMFSKKHAHEHIYDMLLENLETMEMIERGINLLEVWTTIPAKYTTKQERIDALKGMNIQKIVEETYTRIMSVRGHTTLASMASQIGMGLGFADTKQGITLAAEILAVLSRTGFFMIYQPFPRGQRYVKCSFELDDETQEIVDRAMYMPPMITKPQRLKHNRSSGYQTIKGESLILGGAYKHHDYHICLDVLNTMNSVALSVNEEFRQYCLEEPTSELDEIEGAEQMTQIELMNARTQKRLNWEDHVRKSTALYDLMIEEGNHFYLTNKVDTRGRIYSQGHHINPQGTSFKKSVLDLHRKEKIDVPKDFF